MKLIGKMGKAYECFADFRSNNNAKEYKQFVDIFFPMLCNENNHRLDIIVGKKVSDSNFISFISCVTHKFTVIPSVYNNEPQLIIRDFNGCCSTLINICLVKDLYIKADETDTYLKYNICFNYNNEIDYQMHIIVNKE